MTELRELSVLHTQLAELPESIGDLARLEILDLDNNQLISLPASIGRLTHLNVLRLHRNRLSALPETVGKLSDLTELDVSSNKLTALPESIGELGFLLSLNLTNNQLTTLPSTIGQLTQLRELHLGNNRITNLSESIGWLTRLITLWLHNNRLRDLPKSIGQLTQLQSLTLENNFLTELPETIGTLSLLPRLTLHGNELTTLPESLANLKSLRELYLHGNKGLGLPAEVLGPTFGQVSAQNQQAKPNEILKYYFRVRGDRRPLNEAKLILVGRGAVGKTSIVNRLVHNSFNKDEKKTEGIRITDWKLHLRTDEQVRLNVWDFGGQEIMHATHQFFLTQRSLYLLAVNGRGGVEDADAEYWLKLIESFGGESPVIVVLNKVKEHPFDLNRRALQQKFPAIRDFIKTDCADGTGIKQLAKAIERETDRLEHLRDAFPASWFTIKDQLAGMERNYLSFDEYRKVCAKFGERDKAAQDSLAGYLHNLGIALNYKDDLRLQDTHVLNPHWVTNGIYQILNSGSLEKQKGEIRLNDLSGILEETEYPRSMHRFIFDLMKKFDLCFSFPDDDCHYLIPELLHKQEPESAADFKPEKCLNFQYHYTVLPEGLLPRFIVRTHALSEGLRRWRTGVTLRFGGCRALVKADVQDKKVFISVSGVAAARRRELLAIIRSDFERIHRDIRNLQPREMIPVPEFPSLIVPYRDLLVMEREGIKRFPKVVDTRVTEVNIQELLNGVELEGPRRTTRASEVKSVPLRLFYSYSHKDEGLRNELETHLKLLQRQELIETWHDRRIDAGDEWKGKIDENLERADIILLLISADFIASDYCYEIEMKHALNRHNNKETRVIPVIARDVDWIPADLAKLQLLPKDGKPVLKWRPRDSGWRNVAEGIRQVVKAMRTDSER